MSAAFIAPNLNLAWQEDVRFVPTIRQQRDQARSRGIIYSGSQFGAAPAHSADFG